MSDDLNGPDRFTKRSSRYVLEEHSHCEVPAGCGGVVLRWIEPAAQVPVRIHVFARRPAGAGWVTLDGAVPESVRPLIARGPHVLAMALSVDGDNEGGVLAFAMYEVTESRRGSKNPEGGFALRTADDGTWRASRVEPDEGWRTDPFDDSAWEPLVALRMTEPEGRSNDRWRIDDLRRQEAVELGLPGHRGPLWVRRRFEVPPFKGDAR